MSALLDASNISKRFGTKRVLHSLTFSVAQNSIHLLAGENGSGKTTLLKIIAGISLPDAGALTFSFDAPIKYVGNLPGLYGKLSVIENIEFFSHTHSCTPEEITNSLQSWGLTTHKDVPVASLSKGQQMRVALLIAMLCQNSLIILDEPTAFLDQATIAVFIELLVKNKNHNTFIIATHDTSLLSRQGLHTLTLKEGRFV